MKRYSGSVKSRGWLVVGLGFGASTPGIAVVVGFPFTASTAPPCSPTWARERSNLNRPRRDRLIAATASRSIIHLQFEHHSFRFSRLSSWSLSPHRGQMTLVPLVRLLLRRIIGSPTHRALYSSCRWASPKLQLFIRCLRLGPCPLPLWYRRRMLSIFSRTIASLCLRALATTAFVVLWKMC
jgi:hypothetical protein